MMDVYIRVPVKGPFEWLQLATRVDLAVCETLQGLLQWESKCVPCVDLDQATVTPICARDVGPHSTEEVWMCYPAVNQKDSWGRIATNLTPVQAATFHQDMVRKISIMPQY